MKFLCETNRAFLSITALTALVIENFTGTSIGEVSHFTYPPVPDSQATPRTNQIVPPNVCSVPRESRKVRRCSFEWSIPCRSLLPSRASKEILSQREVTTGYLFQVQEFFSYLTPLHLKRLLKVQNIYVTLYSVAAFFVTSLSYLKIFVCFLLLQEWHKG